MKATEGDSVHVGLETTIVVLFCGKEKHFQYRSTVVITFQMATLSTNLSRVRLETFFARSGRASFLDSSQCPTKGVSVLTILLVYPNGLTLMIYFRLLINDVLSLASQKSGTPLTKDGIRTSAATG